MLAIVVRFITKKEEFKFFTTEHICFTWFGGTYSTSIINTLNGGFVGRSICCERPPLRSDYHVKECCKEHVGLSVNLAPPAMETFALSVFTHCNKKRVLAFSQALALRSIIFKYGPNPVCRV